MTHHKRQIVVLIGKPASGKGTQAEPLAKALSVAFVSMGKMLRDEIKKKTPLGRRADAIVRKGKLVPCQLTISLLRRRLAKADARKGIVLDGFPREIEQARALEKIARVTHAVLISITDKEVMHRIAGRRVCANCGRNYHLVTDPPKKKGICDDCGGKLIQRYDDKPSVIRDRLESYREDTIPVLHFYRRLRVLRRIEGVGSIEDVRKHVLAAIERNEKSIDRHAQRNR
jgi:adenylate kinase